jgi:AsmA protein
MRKLLLIAGAVVLVVLIAVVALGILVDADRYRPQAEQQATQALGRQVTIGKLKLSLFAGGITAEKLSIADDPAFSQEPFLTADSMTIGVDMGGLIFHRRISVHSFVLHQPKVHLVQNRDGEWNYSTLGGKKNASPTPTAKGGPAPEFSVGKFLLDDGQVSVLHLANNRTSAYTKLKIEATDIALSAAIPYTLTAQAPSGGTVEVKGSFGPLAEQSEHTPLNAALHVKAFDIGSTGFTESDSALKGIVDVDGELKSDGTRSDVTASIIGNKMCLVSGCSPATSPIGLSLKAGYLLTDRLANLDNTVVKLGGSALNVSGTVNLKNANPVVNARADANRLAVADIEGVLPALGVVLPPGARLEGGSASVHATATGPSNALHIKARVVLTNSKLTGYDMNAKMGVVTHLTGVTINKETPIQEFSADVTQDPAGTKVENLLLNMPGLARVTGGGTISKNNELNFALKAVVDISNSAVGKVGSLVGKKNTNLPVPFHVTGTTKDPKVTPDVGVGMPGTGAATAVAGKVGKTVTSGFGGLLGKKNK